MSDIVLGALIGIGGAIVGAIIGSLSSYIITRLQVNARRDELNQQQKYNEQQARIDRLIKARESVLISLREVVGKWLELEDRHMIMAVRVGEANKRRDRPELLKEIQALDEALDEAQQQLMQCSSELGGLKGQICDLKLSKMIEEAENTYEEKRTEMIEIELRLHDILRNYDQQNPKLEEFQSIMRERKLAFKRVRDKLLDVNKRIEELLSGEPSS